MQTLITLLDMITEGKRRKTMVYTEKKVKDKIDKVTLSLKDSATQAPKLIELAKSYDMLIKNIDELTLAKEQMNTDIRDAAEELFDLEDDIYTRVIEVGDVSIQVAKQAKDSVTTKVDYESIIADLIAINGDLGPMITLLKGKYTTETPKKAARAGVKVNIDQPIAESIESVWSSFITKIKGLFTKVDTRIADVKQRVANL